jgi:hypothetical protein
VPFEASGLCSRLPDAGTEYVAAFASQLLGRRHHLFFCLSTARTGDDESAFLVTWQVQGL